MKITTFFLFFLMLFCSAPVLRAQEKIRQETTLQDEQSQTVISVADTTMHIQNATLGAVAELYNVLGVKVFSVKIESPDQVVSLNLPKGYYILKLENIVRKIIIK